MKRRNNKKSLMQQGGLMIEALAMLGLIAVVTPTMYKKSAERTMEVEDINSATTIRTIMNAANDYVGANYSTIISDMNKESGDAAKYRKITQAQIEPYLPYGFNMNKALYNYDLPELAIAKNDNNLTTFALFPAKASADTGIGQERTSRIASLVGASGGYVTGEKKARGIGGIWKLENDDFSKVFPNNASANTYSIVTASADTINAATNNEIDMDKYLQRGRDDNDDDSTLWKNTMRTDLYMGENKSQDDVYQNNNVQDKTYSIRNIKSLIVGAEHANNTNGTDDIDGYGLYMQGDSKNAYIDGMLQAAESHLQVTTDKLNFGNPRTTTTGDVTNTSYPFEITNEGYVKAADETLYVNKNSLAYGAQYDKAGDGTMAYPFNVKNDGSFTAAKENFQVDVDGNTHIKGSLTNDKNVYLANKYANSGETGGWDTIKIGALSATDNPDYIIEANHSTNRKGYLQFINKNIMRIQPEWHEGQDHPGSFIPPAGYAYDRIVMMDGGFKKIIDERVGNYVDVPKIKYASRLGYLMTFPVRIGSNARVDGLLAAGQIDTQKIRTASLAVGSENIDDANKWMTVDKDGVKIKDIQAKGGTRAHFTAGKIALGTDGKDDTDDDNREAMFVLSSSKFDGNDQRTSAASAYLKSTETKIVGEETLTLSGQKALLQATASTPSTTNDITDRNTLMLRNDDMQAEMKDKNLTVSSRSEYPVNYVNIGDMNSDAGVNIVANNPDSEIGSGYKKVLTVDVGGTSTDNKNDKAHTDDGTVYIRKGYVEVKGGSVKNGDNIVKTDALGGNGVIVASRLVANNPEDGAKGAKVVDIFTSNAKSHYGLSSSTRYDTYMVNPAYTSVMHDIKLTTRGGARLSDVLPDFINKGIYVVNNTIYEKSVSSLDKYNTYSSVYNLTKPCETGKECHNSDSDVTLGNEDAWASPLLGAVPAPQCPPGYGRVITLNPGSFQMAQAGSLQNSNASHASTYYVAPYTLPEEIETGNKEKITLMQAEPIMEEADVDISKVKADGQSVTGTAKTSKYVLTARSPNVKPLVFQQSTWLKSMVTPLESGNYTQGWKAIMGFLYPASQFKAFVGSSSKNILQDTKAEVYWNLFPVARGTLEGYATVYCYFDRTNMLTDSEKNHDFEDVYTNYVDSYSYMQNMTGVPTGYAKESGVNYQNRLNDPNLKYNEMW